ncbi:MAG: type IV secretory system conjugative DNA transfer family protein [Rhodospirillaceae bacterium]|nr:type IV secretory system conjugative DNA transfer family protein [Rhodospirillaceae bacterium]
MNRRLSLVAALALVLGAAAAADEPPRLESLLAMDAGAGHAVSVSFEDDQRRRAMATAARAFGAQAGLKRRGWEIAGILGRYAPQLHRIYRFRDLMLRESGFMVQPPVLAETREAFRLARDHHAAASAGRVVTIMAPERIVSAVPTWRHYLERAWPDPAPPADVLFPRTDEEEDLWRTELAAGWEAGSRLADEIFADDLLRLNGVFTGLVLWHRLHLAGMVTTPDVGTREVAVAGGGATLRIAERFIAIDQAAALVADPGAWRAVVTP